MIRAFLGSTCLGLAACTTSTALQPLPPPITGKTEIRLVQQGFGAQAHFAYCASPSCPETTPKSFPTESNSLPHTGPVIIPPEPDQTIPTSAEPSMSEALRGRVPFTQYEASQTRNARADMAAVRRRTWTTVSADRPAIHARGRCCDIASNQTAERRARNRRVEIAATTSSPRSP